MWYWEEDILHVRGGVGGGLDAAVVPCGNRKHTHPIPRANPSIGDMDAVWVWAMTRSIAFTNG